MPSDVPVLLKDIWAWSNKVLTGDPLLFKSDFLLWVFFLGLILANVVKPRTGRRRLACWVHRGKKWVAAVPCHTESFVLCPQTGARASSARTRRAGEELGGGSWAACAAMGGRSACGTASRWRARPRAVGKWAKINLIFLILCPTRHSVAPGLLKA